ncbi:MAG: hypothetical protein DRO94_00100 [Candidatus Altiarchaeales archaeon]|nr:MAG: hypothetical protein DRO94_00100 [Candidatus Altiarchaeales archaeon]
MKYERLNEILLVIIIAFLILVFFLTLERFNAVNKTLNITTTTSTISIPTSSVTTTTMIESTSSTTIPIPTTSTSISTTTTSLSSCVSSNDCGSEFYHGTYFCENGNVALLKYIPRCVHGVCKFRTRVQIMDVCRENETCIPGLGRCVPENRYQIPSGSRILRLNNNEFGEIFGYKFRVEFIQYRGHEIPAVLLSVVGPDGSETEAACSRDMETRIDDLEIGLYSATESSVVIWVKKV